MGMLVGLSGIIGIFVGSVLAVIGFWIQSKKTASFSKINTVVSVGVFLMVAYFVL